MLRQHNSHKLEPWTKRYQKVYAVLILVLGSRKQGWAGWGAL